MYTMVVAISARVVGETTFSKMFKLKTKAKLN